MSTNATTTAEAAKRGRKKAEITVLKEILVRIPKTHIGAIITLVKEYCTNNKLSDCVDDEKEKKELLQLCKAKNIECTKIETMSLSEIKTAIHSISKAELIANATDEVTEELEEEEPEEEVKVPVIVAPVIVAPKPTRTKVLITDVIDDPKPTRIKVKSVAKTFEERPE